MAAAKAQKQQEESWEGVQVAKVGVRQTHSCTYTHAHARSLGACVESVRVCMDTEEQKHTRTCQLLFPWMHTLAPGTRRPAEAILPRIAAVSLCQGQPHQL